MLDPKRINALVDKVVEALPDGVKSLPGDLRDNCRVGIRDALSKLDLVTREEFDAQTKVLARTREKLEALEKQVSDLESR